MQYELFGLICLFGLNNYMKQLKLHVSKSDIKNGELANPQNCAIARTLKRNKHIKIRSVSVLPSVCTIKTINKSGKTQTLRASLSEEAREFITNFDHGLPVMPFKLVLNFAKNNASQLTSVTNW
jgi:hypothetical protein